MPTVRPLGLRRDRFVEFVFAADDSRDETALEVELVLPLAAFAELCAREGARIECDDPALLEHLRARAFASIELANTASCAPSRTTPRTPNPRGRT